MKLMFIAVTALFLAAGTVVKTVNASNAPMCCGCCVTGECDCLACSCCDCSACSACANK